MNDAIQTILSRRSVRKYTDEPIGADNLRMILKCAMSAPSACNEQPWHFLVFQKPETKAMVAKTSPYTGMAARADTVIVVCGDLSLEKAKGFWVQDCSAAVENLMLAARALGIGSVWCGVHPVQEREEYLKKNLGLPESVIPFAIICLGRTDSFHEENRFREERIHMEKWQA